MNQNFAKKAMLVASLTLGIIGFNSNLGHARKAGPETGDFGTNWKSYYIDCTISTTVLIGGAEIPASLSRTVSYQGKMRKCFYGDGLCFWDGPCS